MLGFCGGVGVVLTRGCVECGQPIRDVHQLIGHPWRLLQQRAPYEARSPHTSLPQRLLHLQGSKAGCSVQLGYSKRKCVLCLQEPR
jgi:hypothetical protein